MTSLHRVLVVEDHGPFRRVISGILRQRADVLIVGEAADGQDAIRQAEAESMLLELATREQAFRAQNGRYLPLRADARSDASSRDEDPEAFYPQPADSPRLASARRPTRIEDRSLWPASWRTLAVRPKTDLPYCTYLVNAGQGGRPAPEMTYGAALLPTDVNGPWFYALAACNFGGWARFPGGVTVYGLSSEALVPRAFDVGR